MPLNVALADLVAPYLLKADALGPMHAAFSVIRATRWEVARDDFGTVIRGTCEFSGRSSIDIVNRRLVVTAGNDDATPPFDPARRAPVFDLRETKIEFELHVPLLPSGLIQAADTAVAAASFLPARAAMADWTTPPNAYPAASFSLDLVLMAPTLRPPFLQPAQLTADGLLAPHDALTEVVITLPRLRMRLDHDMIAPGRLNFEFLSAGVAGLDDPGDISIAELVSMAPPHAFIGGKSSRTIGFGFRKAVLDLSDNSTPPEILAKFGVGDDWGGLYLPEVRFFASPQGARGFAFEAGVRDLLIGFGDDAGISGDFEVALINQGGGGLTLSARFFDEDGRAFGLDTGASTSATTVALPPRTRMVVDVGGGRQPFQVTAKFGNAAPSPGRLFLVDMAGLSQQVITIACTDASTPIGQASLTITVIRRQAPALLPTPRPGPPPATPATLTLPTGSDPAIVVAGQTDTTITLTLSPPDGSAFWSVDGGPESGPRGSLTVPLAPGEMKNLRARIPGQSAPDKLAFYFFFDKPGLVPPADEANSLHAYAAQGENAWTTKAVWVQQGDGRLPGGQRPEIAHRDLFETIIPPGGNLIARGEASFEGDATDAKRDYNYHLARRRAIAARQLVARAFAARGFQIAIDPEPPDPRDYPGLAAWTTRWKTQGPPTQRDFWVANLELPNNLNRPARQSVGALQRPAAKPVPPLPVPVDPPPSTPPPPDWFRSARLRVRIVRNKLVAFEMTGELDFQTAAEDSIAKSGQAPGVTPDHFRSLTNGASVGPNNPGDGITDFHLLVQHDDATDLTTTLFELRADPSDTNGLLVAGWMPGETRIARDGWRNLLGSYISFWPLLVTVSDGNKGRTEDAVLLGATAALPLAVSLLPWFTIERVILFGAELLVRDKPDGFESFLLFDVEADWSVKIALGGMDLVTIDPTAPLALRYKAIGMRLDVRDAADKFPLRPVFDSSRGYSIELAKGAGGLRVAEPFGKILKVLAARISKSNPLTFEIDIGLGVDLGVVTIERAGLRVFLDGSRPPELTALAAKVDVPGALVGEGFVEISSKSDPDNAANRIATIGGEIDLTLRPLALRISASVEIAQISEGGQDATGVYVGLSIVLPVGIPLGTTGLGIFGFRGIFGMHYTRNAEIGQGSSAPALEWLKAAQGEPNRLLAKDKVTKLWVPKLDNWAFGAGALLGTMEGGFLINLDGTVLIELPGPRLLITMKMRYISPPPSVGEMGGVEAGILAVIEITPEHILIGVLATVDLAKLIVIKIPAEAFFSFIDTSDWHFWLGTRAPGQPAGSPGPVDVDVLGLVRGYGYLMLSGNGLDAYPEKNLPATSGFSIALGAGLTYVWGIKATGLYLEVHGGFDAVLAFDPLTIAGTVEIGGELRLFIISIGASASLTLVVRQRKIPGTDDSEVNTHVKGEVCGRVKFLFFTVKGCVSIEIGDEADKPPIPDLVRKLSIKSRSPALAQGTATGRPVDASLGDAIAAGGQPAASDPNWVTVPIDAIPILALELPPATSWVDKAQGQPDQPGALSFNGVTVPSSAGSPGLPASGFAEKGDEGFAYTLRQILLERIDPAGAAYTGSHAPVTWQTLNDPSDPQPAAALALLTWEPTPAPKIFEKSKKLEEMVKHRWGRTCDPAAPPTNVFWTFRHERPGPSAIGWALEGVAWPDPVGSKRSAAPDTALRVHERWRSGDADLDARRGVQPALIITGFVPCQQPTRDSAADRAALVRLGGFGAVDKSGKPPRAGQALAATDAGLNLIVRRAAIAPFRVSARYHAKVLAGIAQAARPVDLASLIAQLNSGAAVSAADMEGAILDPTGASRPIFAARVPSCQVRLLQAPARDDGRALVFGTDTGDLVAQAVKAAGVSHGPLDDVVVLQTGAFAEGAVMLFIRRDLIERRAVRVRVLDAQGGTIATLPPPDARAVNATADLPSRWSMTAGPWADETADLLAYRAAAMKAGYLAMLQPLEFGKEAAAIEIGVTPGTQQPGALPAYLVGAIAMTRMAEVIRAEWDDSESKKAQATLVNVLGPTPTDDALMVPGAVYRVTATWDALRRSDAEFLGNRSQSFWFRTDAVAPVMLDPWVLITRPEDGEAGVFGREPLRIAFNTHDVDRLFAAYGQELRIRLQAASGAHPKPAPAAPHPWPLTEASLEKVGPAILSPWEEALETVMAGKCVPIDENRARHSVSIIPIPLDPYTDYLLDVESVPLGAPADATGPRVYRRRFSTGAYGTLAEFAAGFQATRPRARGLAAGAVAAITAFFNGRRPDGDELDARLKLAGIAAAAAPRSPAITVLWESAGGPPQPTGVLIDAPAAIWRSRVVPLKLVDNDGAEPIERYTLQSRVWLALQPTPGAPPLLAVNGEIRAPGNARVLLALAPGARGKRLRFDLVRLAEAETYLLTAEERFTVIDIELGAAPWEEAP